MKTITQEYYVIRHNPTGKFLPEPTGRNGRGGSHTEPVDGLVQRPRLFQTKLSAQRTLASWLQGKHTADYDTDCDEYGGNSFTYQSGVNITPQPDRVKEDMEIIPVYLQILN